MSVNDLFTRSFFVQTVYIVFSTSNSNHKRCDEISERRTCFSGISSVVPFFSFTIYFIYFSFVVFLLLFCFFFSFLLIFGACCYLNWLRPENKDFISNFFLFFYKHFCTGNLLMIFHLQWSVASKTTSSIWEVLFLYFYYFSNLRFVWRERGRQVGRENFRCYTGQVTLS